MLLFERPEMLYIGRSEGQNLQDIEE